MEQPLHKTSWQFLLKLNIHSHVIPNSTLGIDAKEMEAYAHKVLFVMASDIHQRWIDKQTVL